MRPLPASIVILAATLAVSVVVRMAEAAPGLYLSTADFVETAFTGAAGEPESLIVDAELRSEIEQILGHPFARLRLRYWRSGDRTAWVLDEIGKTEPITIGVTIESGNVSAVRVLEFRESRGWEIRYPFFTDQFNGARLDGRLTLDRSIDGITGATLSVIAVDKVVRTALLLDGRVRGTGESKAAISY